MARKKIEPITSLGNEDKLTVQKSLPLFALWQSDLTLSEFKILDTYLSRIDSHKPERRVVMFKKGELENLLGVQKIDNKVLELRLKHLMGNVVKLEDKESKKGYRLVTLFEEAIAEQDDYGLWQVRLECTQKAMKYFFNIENLRYLRYKLRSITSLTSRYTYIMFIYLEANRFRKTWEVDLEELKVILQCNQEPTYQEYKHFNNLRLKKIQKEIHEKTECRYSYEPIKVGKRVVKIKFTLETLSDQVISAPEKPEIEGQMTIDDFDDLEANYTGSYFVELARVVRFQFNQVELEALNSLLTARRPSGTTEEYCSDLKIAYSNLQVQKTREKIHDDFAYIKGIIKRMEPLKKAARSLPEYNSSAREPMNELERQALEKQLDEFEE